MGELGLQNRKMYLDLLRDILTNTIYDDPPIKPVRKNSLRRLIGLNDGYLEFDATTHEKGVSLSLSRATL
jgi:hypothetical protein